MRSSWLAAITTTTLILLGGCSVGPDYHPPVLNLPAHWSEPLTGGETNRVASLADWWKVFNDPELNSLITRAVQGNLQLRVAQARVREALAQRGVTAAAWWPSVNASGSYDRDRLTGNYFLPLPADVPLNYNWYQAGFDASWELDVFGGTRRAVQAANAAIAAAEFSHRDVLVTLLAEVARYYFEARSFQQRLAIARRNIASQQNALNLTRDRYRAGLSSELDVEQASALLASTEAQVPTLESSLRASIHHLSVLLAEPPGTQLPEPAPDGSLPSPPPPVPVGLPSDLLLRRPDVRQAERQLAAATARIGVAKSDLFPKFSLTGAAGFESVSASSWFTPDSRFWTAGPTITWRIFDAGRIRANIRVQNARQEQALASYEQTVLTAFEDVENALVAYAKEQVRFQSLQASDNAERRALNLSLDLYKNGLADFLRVLDSERSLYSTEDALVQSQKTVSENLIALYKALGGGWAAGPGPAAPSATRSP
jgi:outer membrane protein, multidrug efflux system